ncbi:MAG: 4Fe-4S dicluster domain-containing protein [Pseudomonadota bacterium]
MKKWNLIIDLERGVDFINAVLSAKDEYVGNEHPGYSAPVALESSDIMTLERKVRGQTPVVDATNLLRTCNHCDDAPCLKIGGDAVRKRDDGIVIIDPEKAKGRKDLVDSCPYGAVVWNEELQLPQAWIFDAHLLDNGWDQPRCVQSCASSGGIEAIKTTDEDMQRRVKAEGLEVLKPELNTRPRVYYRNLYRYNTCFVGGTVVTEVGSTEECLEGVKVMLHTDDIVLETKTDVFGEFRIDRLEPRSGDCKVVIEHPGFKPESVGVNVQESVYVGVIKLDASNS